MCQLIQYLNDDNLDNKRVGNKAYQLHRLIHQGFKVPMGFVIDAYVNLEEISDTQLAFAVAKIGGFPIAARSSSSFEDMESASFAGQYESFLNIESIEKLRDKIAECRQSEFSNTAVAYRLHQKIEVVKPALAVLVQKMVDVNFAGVAFGINPISGIESEAIIEVVSGLGDKLVGGLASPSTIVANYESDQIVSEIIGVDGVELDLLTLNTIKSTLLKVGSLYGKPQDIEWAMGHDKNFYILQTRAVTKFNYEKTAEEWTNADFRDGGISARVCTPLMYSLYESAFVKSMNAYTETIGLKSKKNELNWMRMAYGRAYWNASAVKSLLIKIPGYCEKSFDNDLGINKNYGPMGPAKTPTNIKTVIPALPIAIRLEIEYARIKKYCKNFEATFRLEKAKYNKKIADFALTCDQQFSKDLVDIITKFHIDTESSYFRVIYNNSNFQADFKNLVRKIESLIGKEINIVDLIGGLNGVSHLEMQEKLTDLYDIAVSDTLTGKNYREKLKEFVKEFSHHAAVELDLMTPRWGEDCEIVHSLIADFVAHKTKPSSSTAIFEGQKLHFEKTVAQIAALLSKNPLGKILYLSKFKSNLSKSREFLVLRERMRDYSTQCYELLRYYVLEASKRLMNDGLILQQNDIFMLNTTELIALFRDNDKSVLNRISHRKTMYENYKNVEAPNEFGGGITSFDEHALQNSNGNSDLSGLGCSSGITTGIVRIINDISEIGTLRPGEILVTKFTDPGWTPVLGIVSGVITEVGGMLSHAAVIGREFGIPAILNVKGATKRLTSGQQIKINGTTGEINFIEEV